MTNLDFARLFAFFRHRPCNGTGIGRDDRHPGCDRCVVGSDQSHFGSV